MYRKITLAVLVLIFSAASAVFANDMEKSGLEYAPAETAGHFKLGFMGNMANGADDFKVGTVLSSGGYYYDAKVSAGGGEGWALITGIGIIPEIDLDLTIGGMKSSMHGNIMYGESDFTKNYAMLDMKYRFKASKHLHIKVGGGVGYYWDNDLRVKTEIPSDGSNPAVFSRWGIDYKNTVGSQFVVEMESFLPNNFALITGMSYFSVKYDADKVTVNGSPYHNSGRLLLPTDIFPTEDLGRPNGSGYDLHIGLVRYF